MNQKVKVFAAFISILLIMSIVLSGCGGTKTDNSKTPGNSTQGTTTVSDSKKPITFDFFVNASWYKWPEWGKDEISRLIQEKTGVTLNFITPNAADNQQMNLMIASGDLPDYVFNDMANPTFKKAIAAGVFEELTPLMDQYAPEMKTRLGDSFWKLNTAQDGKNYFFANAEMRPSNMDRFLPVGPWNPAQFVREDLYKAMGSPKIDTPDDLLNVLKTVKDKYPDVTPFLIAATTQPTAYDFTGQPVGFQLITSNFGVEKYYDNNGKLFASYRSPNYLEALKYINKLYNAGIIKRSDLAMTPDQYKAIKESGKAFYMFDSVGSGFYVPPANKDVKYVYAPMFPNAKILQQNALAWGGWFITKKCKDKKRAIEFMSYMVSDEGEKLSTWGVEGKDWKMVGGKPEWTDIGRAALKVDPRVGKYWFNLDLYDHWIQEAEMVKNPEVKQALDLYLPHKDVKMYLLVNPPDPDKEEATILQKIKTEYSTTFPNFIMAKDEAELTKLYNEFVKKADDMGMPKIEAVWNQEADKLRAIFK